MLGSESLGWEVQGGAAFTFPVVVPLAAEDAVLLLDVSPAEHDVLPALGVRLPHPADSTESSTANQHLLNSALHTQTTTARKTSELLTLPFTFKGLDQCLILHGREPACSAMSWRMTALQKESFLSLKTCHLEN